MESSRGDTELIWALSQVEQIPEQYRALMCEHIAEEEVREGFGYQPKKDYLVLGVEMAEAILLDMMGYPNDWTSRRWFED